jgi:hypothetical protein
MRDSVHSINKKSEMESAQRTKASPTKPTLATRKSRSSGTRDGDGFYPKTPGTPTSVDERQSETDKERD